MYRCISYNRCVFHYALINQSFRLNQGSIVLPRLSLAFGFVFCNPMLRCGQFCMLRSIVEYHYYPNYICELLIKQPVCLSVCCLSKQNHLVWIFRHLSVWEVLPNCQKWSKTAFSLKHDTGHGLYKSRFYWPCLSYLVMTCAVMKLIIVM